MWGLLHEYLIFRVLAAAPLCAVRPTAQKNSDFYRRFYYEQKTNSVNDLRRIRIK